MNKNLERILIGMLGILVGAGISYSTWFYSPKYKENPSSAIEGVYFSPQDNCSEQLIKLISEARESIYVEIYSFTEKDIADALIEARKRGVDVRVLFDNEQASIRQSLDEYLEKEIEIRFDKGAGKMHNKVLIIDNELVATGSFNYTFSANTKNNENLMVLKDRKTASLYLKEFENLWQNSKKR